MSEKLVKKWLGDEKEHSKEYDDQLKQRKEEEVQELYTTIDKTLKNAFAKSLDDGCKSLAQIHQKILILDYSLFITVNIGLNYFLSLKAGHQILLHG